jgi:hypothetical protein
LVLGVPSQGLRWWWWRWWWWGGSVKRWLYTPYGSDLRSAHTCIFIIGVFYECLKINGSEL